MEMSKNDLKPMETIENESKLDGVDPVDNRLYAN